MSFSTSKDRPEQGEQWSSQGAGGSSSSSSQSTAFQDPQTVWSGQSPYLQGLYQQGADALGQSGMAQQQAQGIYGQAQDAYGQFMNPGINPQLEAYSGEVQRNLERNLLPTIQGQAGQFGQMGGARQGVAEGIALGDANQQITDMAANLYGQDMDRMGNAMMAAPGLASFGQQIPWYAMNQYAGLLGDPTVLGGASGSQSTGQSSSSDSSYGESYGYDYDAGSSAVGFGLWT